MTSIKTHFSSQGKYGDLYSRLIFLLLALVVFRVGTHITVPGVDPSQLAKLFQSQQEGILGMFNLFSGGALSRFSIFALGIMPYISASIVMQLLAMVVPSLALLKKEGVHGSRKITQYTRYLTLGLAVFQAIGVFLALRSQVGILYSGSSSIVALTVVVSLVSGTMFLMWLGEQITERGLGNGISMIIFSGIVAGLPSAIAGLFELVRTGAMTSLVALFVIFVALFVTAFVVFVERAQRRILVNYAKRQVGNKIYGGQSSHLPLKLNMAGVIPPIFASSIILFPVSIANWFSSNNENNGYFIQLIKNFASTFAHGQPLYMLLYASAIIFFCFFYTALVFNSKETADNLKKSGAYVPGIRPGEQTSSYIDTILLRLTLVGAMYMVFVCLLPELLVSRWNIPFSLGGTALLIVVVVTMDFMAQIQSYLMSQQYGALLKKANFKGGLLPLR